MMKFNPKKLSHCDKVQDIIMMTVSANPGNASWQDIVAAVKTLFEVKNWLHIRALLQHLKNSGQIHRVADVHKELYDLGVSPS